MGIREITNEAVEVLKARGLNARAYIETKPDGTQYEAVTIIEEGRNLAPIINTAHLLEKELSPEQMANEILKMHYANMPKENISLDHIFTREYLNEHISLRLRPSCSDDVLSRDFLDLKLTLVVNAYLPNGKGTITIKKNHLEHIEVPEDDLWEMAYINLYRNATVETTIESLKRKMDIPEELMEDFSDGLCPSSYILTDLSDYYGAAQMMNLQALKHICEKENTDKLIILPSSVHEVMVIAYDEALASADMNDTIAEVNSTMLDEGDVLSTHPYYYWDKTGEVTAEEPWNNNNVCQAEINIVNGVFNRELGEGNGRP